MELRQVELFIRRPGHPDRRMLLPRGEHVAGRAEDCEIVLADVGVSRRHARIRVDPREVQVEDLQSGNGTFMGPRRITAVGLKDGDEVRIDPFVLSFRLVHAGSQPAAARMALPSVARLEVVSAHAIGKGNFPLPADGILTMGRAENNDIVLPEPQASRNHAEVVGSAGTWVLRDKGSANGTEVNGHPIKERRLQEGDKLRIGAVELRFTQTLASVEVEFGDRTENFDGVLQGTVEEAPVVRPAAPEAKVATRLSTSPTSIPGRPAPAALESTRTPAPTGELPREMPFSRRANSLPPAPAPAPASAAAAPAPAPRIAAGPGVREDPPPYRAPASSPLANPVVQVALVGTVFMLCAIGAVVVWQLARMYLASTRVEAPPVPAVTVVETPVPAVERPAAEPAPTASTDAAVARATPEAAPPVPAEPPRAPSAPSAPPAEPTEAVAARPAALTAASNVNLPAVARPGEVGGTDAEKLVVAGRSMLDEGSLYEGAANFFKALQLEPTNTEAEHWGYAACELIALDQMRGSMKGIALTPVEAPSRRR